LFAEIPLAPPLIFRLAQKVELAATRDRSTAAFRRRVLGLEEPENHARSSFAIALTSFDTLMEFTEHFGHTGAANPALRWTGRRIVCIDPVQTMPPAYSDESVYRVPVVQCLC
jgi:hypothetical protein